MKNIGLLPANTSNEINFEKSTIENFVALNKVCGGRRKPVPLSTFESSFVSLSELDLIAVFWRDDDLKALLREYVKGQFNTDTPSKGDIEIWLSGKEPGHLITKLLTDIGSLGEDKRKTSRRFKVSKMSLSEMQEHIQVIRDDDFDFDSYEKRGYVPFGSIRTDGFLLQLLAFKMNELNAVKYRRLSKEKLGRLKPRITSTVGGTDYFLTEVRNVVKTKQDVVDLWKCEPQDIKILGVDLGQACVVGASALLPTSQSSDPAAEPKFYNLAVKQKAVYQPTFKHRRWLERRKAQLVHGSQSISDIESSLPPLCGNEGSIQEYVRRLQEVEEHLESFYNSSNVIKKHRWNARRARNEEFRRIADSLLRMVGGSVGRKRADEDKVVIAIGLGQFSSKSRLSSLHESFQSYFVKLVSTGDGFKHHFERLHS